MAGRHLRTVSGVLLLGVVPIVFLTQHVWPYHEVFTWPELGLSGTLMVVGLMLVDRESGREVLEAVKDKLPILGKKAP